MMSMLTTLIQAFTILWDRHAQEGARLNAVYAAMHHEQRITPTHATAIVGATGRTAAAYAPYVSSLAALLAQDHRAPWLALLPRRPLDGAMARELVLFPSHLARVAHQRWMADRDPWPPWWQATMRLSVAYADAGWPAVPSLKEITPIMFLPFADQPSIPYDQVETTLRQYDLARFVGLLTTIVHDADTVLDMIQHAAATEDEPMVELARNDCPFGGRPCGSRTPARVRLPHVPPCEGQPFLAGSAVDVCPNTIAGSSVMRRDSTRGYLGAGRPAASACQSWLIESASLLETRGEWR